tara:strand:+ start:650 stop:832 length:183 start_codon:yes stop_codon:yes gene_type:complete
MYPVKVYDKHGKLIKEYSQDELSKRSDDMFNQGKNKYRDKQKAFHKKMKQKKEHNIETKD